MNEDSNSNNPDSNSNPIPSPSSTNPILDSTSNPNPSLPSSRSAEQNQETEADPQDNSYSNQTQDSLNSNLTSSSSLTDNSDISIQDHQPSSPNPSTTTSVSTSSSKPGKKHRTVRSLTRQYESDNKNQKNLSLQSFPSSSTSTTSQSPSNSNSTSPTNLSPTNLHHHSRRPSAVLLASATYPSTLNSDPINQTSIYSRSRTSSSTSINSTSDKRIRTTSTTSNHKSNNNNRADSSSPSNRSLTLPTVESSPSSNHKSTSNSINSTPNQSSSLVASPTESSTSMTGLPILSVSQDEDHSSHSHHHHHYHHEKETSSSSSSSTSTTGTSLKPSTNQDDDEEEEGMDSIAELSHSSSSSSSVGGGGGGKKVAGGQGSLSPGEEKGKPLDQMSASERRDHSRKHSRVHSRNLSVFFPRPGTEAEVESDLAKAKDVFGSTTTSNDNSPGHLSIDTTGIDKQRNTLNVPNGNGNGIGTISPTQSRRGHHHKHSVVFSTNESLLSPSSPNHNHNHNHGHGNGSGSTSDDDQLSSNDLNSPIGKLHSHQHSHHHHHHHDHSHQHQPTLTPLNYSKAYSTTSNHDSHPFLSSIPYLRNVPSNLIPSLTFGFLHFLLGSSLWVSGQSNDSLSVTGLGYLVVFDSFGILSLVVSELKSFGRSNLGLEDNRGESIRKPFSSHRLSVLLHFTQSIYLLFAAVYVCKESVEHALLEGSDSEEHAHSAAHKESDGIILPWFLLLLATLFCVASNVLFGNHAKLVAACGISTTSTSTPIHRGHGRQTSVLTSSSNLAGPFANLLSNPFSLTVFFFCSTLLFASLTMPPFQASALDKVLAGMESAAMAYIAYPASKALGKVLLQTAPEGGESNALNGLKRAVKIIEEHPLVTFVAPPHIWQLTPPTSALSAPLGSNPNNNPLASSLALGTVGSRGAKSAALVATLQIFIKPESSDSDCLDITRWAWERAAPSIGAGAGLKAGDNLRGSIMAGELVVQVEREGVKEEENLKNPAALDQHSHSHDHHHHDHSHHNHSHHDHSHHHHHHHDHDHSHSHGQSHDHDQSSHSHEHSTHSHHH